MLREPRGRPASALATRVGAFFHRHAVRDRDRGAVHTTRRRKAAFRRSPLTPPPHLLRGIVLCVLFAVWALTERNEITSLAMGDTIIHSHETPSLLQPFPPQQLRHLRRAERNQSVDLEQVSLPDPPRRRGDGPIPEQIIGGHVDGKQRDPSSIAGGMTSGGGKPEGVQDPSDPQEQFGVPAHMRRSFRGIENVPGVLANVTKVSFVLYRVIKNYELNSMADCPAHSNVLWMPRLLERIDWEFPGFTYIGVDDSRERIGEAKGLIRDFGNARFVLGDTKRFDSLPSADLLFSYGGLQEWGFRRSWKFFMQARKREFKFILFTNNQGAFNLPSDLSIVNVKRPPFNFQAPAKTVPSVQHTQGNNDSDITLQLLLYNVDQIRQDM